mgnify:CR=1 FL=1
MKIKNQYKFLSLVFSLTLVVSALGIGLPTSAADTAVNTITTVTEKPKTMYTFDKYMTNGNNLKDSFGDVSFWQDGKVTDVVSNYISAGLQAKWTNCDVREDSGIVLSKDSGSITDTNNDTEQTTSYWRLCFKINGALNNPTGFLINFHKSGEANRSQHYAVFASDTYENLEKNKIIEIKDTNGFGDYIDVETLKLTGIKYVEVRIYHRAMNDKSWAVMGQHINELGFFGGTVETDNSVITKHESYSSLDDVKTQIDALETNRLAEQTYETSKFYIDNTNQGTEQISSWADDFFSKDIKTSSDSGAISRWHNAKTVDNCRTTTMLNDIFQTSAYRELVVDLNATISNPEKFVFSFNYDGRASKHYAVYMSDTRDGLYDDANKVAEVYDASRDRKGDLIDLSSLKDKVVSYVSIRIYNFGNESSVGCKAQYISHIGLYGGTVVGDVNGNGTVNTDDVNALRTYLLTNTAVEGYVYDVNSDGKENICDLVYVNDFIK